MMGKQAEQPAFLYDFALDKHVPADHMLRSIDRFVELLIRMLLVGYCYGHTMESSAN